ncbi:hypothetical protein ACFQZS_03890 [Mucilaginibacter calamicampi]|uniref:Uncharacterized protein n=1 Tax=Mucilaginibacter calamicampi TaxID=1302352 RepID=A0ABW2YSQ6_9SPHI
MKSLKKTSKAAGLLLLCRGLLQRSENAGGGGRDRSGILRRRYSGEPGPDLSGAAQTDKNVYKRVFVTADGKCCGDLPQQILDHE